MKVTGQSVPPELADLYTKLVTNTSIDGDGNGIISTHKKITAIKTPQIIRRFYIEALQAAEYIADILKLKPDSVEWKNFVYEEADRILNQVFKTTYWIECEELNQQIFESRAGNTNDDSTQHYDYPDSSRKPSHVTYGNGSGHSGTPTTIGSVTGGRWLDGTWTWERKIFRIHKSVENKAYQPLIWITEGTMTANASTRGSRPMFSIQMKANIVGESSTMLTDTSPPLKPSTSLYWRYKPISDTAPYYQASTTRRASVVLNKRAKYESSSTLTKAIIKSGPRPMLGRGYNNNDTVTTTYNGVSKLYEMTYPYTINAWKRAPSYPYTYGIAIDQADKGMNWFWQNGEHKIRGNRTFEQVQNIGAGLSEGGNQITTVKCIAFLPLAEITLYDGTQIDTFGPPASSVTLDININAVELYDTLTYDTTLGYYEWEMFKWPGSVPFDGTPIDVECTKYHQIPGQPKQAISTRTVSVIYGGNFIYGHLYLGNQNPPP